MIYSLWLSIAARRNALMCVLKGHNVNWRDIKGTYCPGDIICNTCNLIHWCRAQDPWFRGDEEL